MSSTKYTYAVARIRALEVSLFSDVFIDQLMACSTSAQVLQMLLEKGWGDPSMESSPQAVLRREEEKTWEVIKDVAPDIRVFDVFSYPKLYHNLKAAIKAVCTGVNDPDIYYGDCCIAGPEMEKIVSSREFSRLPGKMAQTGREALDILLHTGDGQLCDIYVDRAAMEAVYEAGIRSGEKVIREYADAIVAVADIKIAVRSQKLGKDIDFMKNAMAVCDGINVDRLIRAALAGEEEILRYLEETSYAGGADALRESPSVFERWCDDRITEMLKSQKYETFSAGPLLAYLVARENEIKTVRIILTGRQNGFSDQAIRERIRNMYV